MDGNAFTRGGDSGDGSLRNENDQDTWEFGTNAPAANLPACRDGPVNTLGTPSSHAKTPLLECFIPALKYIKYFFVSLHSPLSPPPGSLGVISVTTPSSLTFLRSMEGRRFTTPPMGGGAGSDSP